VVLPVVGRLVDVHKPGPRLVGEAQRGGQPEPRRHAACVAIRDAVLPARRRALGPDEPQLSHQAPGGLAQCAALGPRSQAR
jgi:hypothetical protein